MVRTSTKVGVCVCVYWLAGVHGLNYHHSHSISQLVRETHGSVHKRSALLQKEMDKRGQNDLMTQPTGHHQRRVTSRLGHRPYVSLPSDQQWALPSWRAIWPGWWPTLPPGARRPRTLAAPCFRQTAPSRRRPGSAAGRWSRWAGPMRWETCSVWYGLLIWPNPDCSAEVHH